MAVGSMKIAKKRTMVQQVPVSGTLTPGAAVTNFTITEDSDGNPVPLGMEIKGITVSHINPSTGAAVSTISNLRLYRSNERKAKHMVYESIGVAATERELNATYWQYTNEDKSHEFFGDVAIQAGEAAAAVVIEIQFEE